MTNERKVQLAMAVDASGARAGFDAVAQAAEDTARKVGAAAGQASQAVDGIGLSADGAEVKLTTRQRSMVAAMQRLQAETQAGSRNTAAYFESLSKLRGEDITPLKPFLEQMRAAEQAAKSAANGVDKIGTSADNAEAKLTNRQRSMVSAMQRLQAETQAGARNTAAYFETLSKLRGEDITPLKPILEQMRAAEQAAKSAAGGVDKIGVSAAQTAAALRGVPAQFTDIVTSLAAGQRPMTVLMQQGGQLKDMFGGAGAAARALGGYVVGLINPFSIAAAAAAGLAYAYSAGADEARAFQRAIILSGQAAGVTASQLQSMAAGVAAIGAGTQAHAAEILAQIASSAGIGAGNMMRLTAAALAFEAAGGPAADETAQAFKDLAKEPLAAALKLNEATGFLTVGLYQQIKALDEQGRSTEAAALAQEAYAAAIETRTPQMVATLGTLETAWMRIKKLAGQAVDGLLGIGRGATVAEQISAASAALARAQAAPAASRFYDADGRQVAGRAAAVKSLQERIEYLGEQARMEQRSADAAAARNASLKANVEWDKETVKYLSKQEQLAREIARIEAIGAAAGKSRAEIDKQIAAAREKAADKTDKKPPTFKAEEDAARTYMRTLEGLTKLTKEQGGAADGLSKTQLKLREAMADPAWASYSRQQREQIITAAAVAQAEEDRAAATKAGAQAAKDAAKDYQVWLGAMERSAAGAEAEAAKLLTESQAQALVIEGYRSLQQAIQLVEIARLREQQTAMMADPAAVAALQREIEARERLARLIGEKDVREANAKAAKDAGREWEKVTDQIGQSLADALMQGGKTAAELLRDLFRTLVLRPSLQFLVQGGTQAMAALLSGGNAAGVANAAGSAQSLQSLAALGNTAISAYTYAAQAYTAAASYLGASSTAGSGLAAMGTTYGSIGGTVGGYGSLSGLGTTYGTIGGTTASGASATGSAMAAGSGGTSALAVGGWVALAVLGAMKASSDWAEGFRAQQAKAVNRELLPGDKLGPLGGYESATASMLKSFGMGDRLADILSGSTAVAKLFGRAAPRVEASGITGTLQGGDFTGTAYADILEKGGWFRSDKRYTRTADLPSDVSGYLDAGAKSVYDQVKAYGAVLSLPAAALANVSTQLKVQIGADEAKNKEAIAAALTEYTLALSKAYGDALKPLAQYGETAADTLGRVATALKNVNDVLTTLGTTPLASSVDGAAAATDLVARFGSADVYASAAGNYLQAYYSAAERQAIGRANIGRSLADYGINALPDTRAGYRALIDAQDLTTASGRAAYAALLQLAGAFADITPAVDDLTQALQTAGQAVQDEIKRLRGETDTADQATLLARFGVATAQARAGDATALADLPALSQALEKAAAATASSALDVARMRAWLADSLQRTVTTVPGFAVGGDHTGGLRIVGEQGPEIEATGPARIYSASETARLLRTDTSALEARVADLSAQLADLIDATRATALHTHSTAQQLRRAMPDGDALAVRTAAA